MRLTLRILGLDVIDMEVTTEATSPGLDDDFSRDLSGGTTGAYPMGFTSHMDAPYEYDMPDRDL